MEDNKSENERGWLNKQLVFPAAVTVSLKDCGIKVKDAHVSATSTFSPDAQINPFL